MDVLTGADKKLAIKTTVYKEICKSLGNYAFETGGILGLTNGIITEFEFDKDSSQNLYEYYPNTVFYENIINKKWNEKDVSFAGVIHSHLYNNRISNQDITYCREIINVNSLFTEMILGILNLSDSHQIKWYLINKNVVKEQKIILL